ncbi:hypothetical protein Airi02_012910 [Actinoallomurus iriomotensis]|uniref:Uncharacterized protein n=1 Tax=Actinoallomurus iriomotensis TaxID=478107 RepID=A0A9W6VZ05_9ACTN|nr:hypothetical protein Airi02_012910 [Actinoallomurus iriomotensis]
MINDNGAVRARLAEPDYQLLWPRALFKAEAARLLNARDLADWNDRCELLLEDAFVRGYEGGPLSEFRELSVGFPDGLRRAAGSRSTMLTAKQQFLRSLMDKADLLHEDTTHRRPYWRERKAGQRNVVVLSLEAVIREFVALAEEFEQIGYFEKRFGKDCVDDSYGNHPSELIEREIGVGDMWPPSLDRLVDDADLFFDLVELLHDFAARPQTRSLHSFAGCGWHHRGFEIESGRAVYRWRVNKILQRSDLGLRLAEDGDDTGRLVTVTDDARTELIHALTVRDDGEPADQVRHAIELFRARGADRHQKRSAVAALALVLEERRHNVLVEALAKSDRGALFDIANNFHIRHQDAKQKRDYDDFYIDWIFWLYLSTIELTNRIIDERHSS